MENVLEKIRKVRNHFIVVTNQLFRCGSITITDLFRRSVALLMMDFINLVCPHSTITVILIFGTNDKMATWHYINKYFGPSCITIYL